MNESIYLGKVKKDITKSQSYNPEQDNIYIQGEDIYLEKHSWDCGWYWGFGYLKAEGLHTHATVFTNELLWHSKDEVFDESIFKNGNDFWIFKDLLIQAYALKDCAEVYHHGGHCITIKDTEVVTSKRKAQMVNRDLSKILDKLWSFLRDLSLNS